MRCRSAARGRILRIRPLRGGAGLPTWRNCARRNDLVPIVLIGAASQLALDGTRRGCTVGCAAVSLIAEERPKQAFGTLIFSGSDDVGHRKDTTGVVARLLAERKALAVRSVRTVSREFEKTNFPCGPRPSSTPNPPRPTETSILDFPKISAFTADAAPSWTSVSCLPPHAQERTETPNGGS